MNNLLSTTYEVIVVGAGQAGLAMGYLLSELGLPYLIVERGTQIAQEWRNRYDSLALITPKEYSELPQLAFPATAAPFPTKQELLDYLDAYARQFDATIAFNCAVQHLAQADGHFVLETTQGQLRARQVVIASGYAQKPYVPAFAQQLAPAVQQLHSGTYKNPGSVRPGTVLVVGSSNSGISIASELAASHSVYLAQGAGKHLPRRILGKDIFEWADQLGLLNLTRDTFLGRRLAQKMLRSGDATYGLYPAQAAQEHRFQLKGRAQAAQGREVRFADGTSLAVDAVVWATGFRPDYHSWVDLPLFDADGIPQHQQGVTAVPGLYFLGLKWQTRITSFLLAGVGRDAALLAQKIVERAAHPTRREEQRASVAV